MTITDQTQMNAVRFDRKGPPDVLQYETVSRPAPLSGEVLVRLEGLCQSNCTIH